MDKRSYTQGKIDGALYRLVKSSDVAAEAFAESGLRFKEAKSAWKKIIATRIKKVIFFLTVIVLFAIVGGMDQECYSPEAGAVLAVADFIIMAWSGFGSGLLRKEDGK